MISTLITYDITLLSKHIQGDKNTHADYLSRYPIEQDTPVWMQSLSRKHLLSAQSRHHIWQMSSTPLSIKEYQEILKRLDAQDVISLTR